MQNRDMETFLLALLLTLWASSNAMYTQDRRPASLDSAQYDPKSFLGRLYRLQTRCTIYASKLWPDPATKPSRCLFHRIRVAAIMPSNKVIEEPSNIDYRLAIWFYVQAGPRDRKVWHAIDWVEPDRSAEPKPPFGLSSDVTVASSLYREDTAHMPLFDLPYLAESAFENVLEIPSIAVTGGFKLGLWTNMFICRQRSSADPLGHDEFQLYSSILSKGSDHVPLTVRAQGGKPSAFIAADTSTVPCL